MNKYQDEKYSYTDRVLIAISIFALFVMLLCLNGCCIQRKCLYYNAARNTKDSTILHIKDSTIFRDSMISVTIPDGTATNVSDSSSHLETSVAASDAWIEDGKLHHKLENKSNEIIPMPIKLPIKLHYEVKYNFRTITNEVEVNVLTSWQHFFVIIGKIFSGIVSLILVWFVIKKLILKR